MIRSARVTSTLILGLALSACASGGPRSGAMDFMEQTRVEVTNQNWADMRVYVVRSGNRFRLGTVSSMSTEVFRLPRSLSSSTAALQLIADPIGSREMHMTQSLNIVPGQLVSFRIENHLAISSVSVW
jgi:hypothetical protein